MLPNSTQGAFLRGAIDQNQDFLAAPAAYVTVPLYLFCGDTGVTRSREPVKDLIFPKEIYENRRIQMERRIAAMKHFLFDDTTCRVSTLLSYFGEHSDSPCGKCDVCRNAKRPHHGNRPQTSKQIEQSVAYALSHHPSGLTINELSHYLGLPMETIVPAVRILLDSGAITRDPITTRLTPR